MFFSRKLHGNFQNCEIIRRIYPSKRILTFCKSLESFLRIRKYLRIFASVTKRAEARINSQKFFTRDSYTQRSRRKKFIHSFRVEKNRRRRELSRRAIIRLTWMSMLLGPAIEFRSLSRPRSRLGFWIGVGEGD